LFQSCILGFFIAHCKKCQLQQLQRIKGQVREADISFIVFHSARYALAGFCCEVLLGIKNAASPAGVTQL